MITKKMVRLGIYLMSTLLFFCYFLQLKKEFKKCTQPVTATYTGVGPILFKSFGHPLLFTYDYNGKHYESMQSMTSQNLFTFQKEKMDKKMEDLGFVKGQRYTVYVNPEQPEEFISDTKSTWHSLTLGGVLLLMIIILELLSM